MWYRQHPLGSLLLAAFALTACQDGDGPVTVRTDDPDVEEPRPVAPTMNAGSMAVEGYPTPGELRTGFIYDRAGQPLEITYEIHDGLAIWQGDIVLGEAGEIARTPAELAYSREGPLPGVVIDDNSARWSGGVIPYTITDATESIVDGAIEMIENQTPGVTLVPRNGEADYVTFRDASGCSSAIGRQGDGQQFINLKVDEGDGESFCSIGNAAHEILHALGMFHEHTRCDRDDFVTINFGNIEAGKEGNFFKAGADEQGEDCGAETAVFDIDDYDFGSIMHYPLDAFNTEGNTITPIVTVDPSIFIGQRSAVGPTDAETIDQLYGDNNAAPNAVIAALDPSYPEGSPVPFDAGGSTDADDDDSILTYAWTFGDGTCAGGAPPSACSDVDPFHSYADDGAYDVDLTVSDGFDEGSDAAVATITNVAPDVDVGSDATLDEGDEFTRSGSFTDPGEDTWTATVDYDDGDGTEPLTLTGKTFGLAHTYVDNGVNTVTVVVTDDDDGVGQDDATIAVNNVAPAVDAGPDATVESGETYDFSGTFSDPGIEDDPWDWVISWGFGPDTEGSTNDQSGAIEASRQVCVAGDYTVTLTVTDKDGGEGMDDLTLTVPYVDVDIDILPGSDENPIRLGRGGNLPVAILGSDDLDVADIDPASLTLGDETGPDTSIGEKNNGTLEAAVEDVNDDGFLDLVAMFSVRDLEDEGELTEFTTELVLRGFLDDACTNIRGVDAVTTLGE